MHTRFTFLCLLIFIFIGIDGCKIKRRTIASVLLPADNVIVFGKSAILNYNSTSQTNGFNLTFLNTGTLTCRDVSIVTTAAYGLVPNAEIFLPSPVTTMPQYSCIQTDSKIMLFSAPPITEGFHPWADNFNIIVGTTTFKIRVNTSTYPVQLLTRGTQSAMNLDSSFTGCGLRGTVLQRVFDCSKKIINYAVYVDATSAASHSATTNLNGTSSYYTLFTGSNPDLYWFVVSCPDTGGSTTVPQQSCHWLTPIVPVGNPALDSGAGVPTFQLSMLTGYQKRLLFSGKMINGGSGYNFAQSNGFGYTTTNEVYMSHPTNPGTTPSTAHPIYSSPSVCTATTGQSLQSGGSFPSSDATIRDRVSISSGAKLIWQMPSYAMLNILAGGTPTISGGQPVCPRTSPGLAGGRPYCNMPIIQPPYNEGFNAINIPSFAMTDSYPSSSPFLEIFWSSSSTGTVYAWAFFALLSIPGGTAYYDHPNLLFGTRCVNLTWY